MSLLTSPSKRTSNINIPSPRHITGSGSTFLSLANARYRHNDGMTMKMAFSLVELSIVLVILGLLTGGILAGQSLIRASELRSVSADYSRYITAVQSFRDRYFAIPGDMPNATRFWGKDNTNCSAHTGTATTGGTCNGNGDGSLNSVATAGTTGEYYQFWKHLALAGLIEGSYTGLSGSGGGEHSIIGTNVPAAKLSNAGWSVYNIANYPGNTEWFAFDYQNMFTFGTQNATSITYFSVLKPEEAWNIDTKLDDGKPGSGKIMSLWNYGCTDATGFSNLTANYALNTTTIVCRLVFPKSF